MAKSKKKIPTIPEPNPNQDLLDKIPSRVIRFNAIGDSGGTYEDDQEFLFEPEPEYDQSFNILAAREDRRKAEDLEKIGGILKVKDRQIEHLSDEHKLDKAFLNFFIRSENVTLSELRRAVKILHPDIETTKYIRGIAREIFKRLNLEGKNVDDRRISVDELSKKIGDMRYNKNKRLA